MHKYFYGILVVLVLALGGFLLYQRKTFLEEKSELNKKLAESEKLVQETKTSWSSRGVEIENLKTDNKELQKIIKAKKEEVLAITNVALQWKNRYFEIKDAKQVIVDNSGSQPASISSECETCFSQSRFRVDFDQTKNDIRIHGFTLTNPAEAGINLEWVKNLELQLILTKGEEGSYRVYIDSKNNDFVPVDLTLKVDPSVLNKKWYEKINFAAGASFGNSLIGNTSWGGSANLGVGYLITHNLNLGLNVSILYTNNLYLFYGANVTWYPFLKK